MTSETTTLISARPDGALLFAGRPRVHFLATCRECNRGGRPHPKTFNTEVCRDRWADGHRTTGHTVDEAVEIRTAA